MKALRPPQVHARRERNPRNEDSGGPNNARDDPGAARDEAARAQIVDPADAHLGEEVLARRLVDADAAGPFLIESVGVTEDLYADPRHDLIAKGRCQGRLVERLIGIADQRRHDELVAHARRRGIEGRKCACQEIGRQLAEGGKGRYLQGIGRACRAGSGASCPSRRRRSTWAPPGPLPASATSARRSACAWRPPPPGCRSPGVVDTLLDTRTGHRYSAQRSCRCSRRRDCRYGCRRRSRIRRGVSRRPAWHGRPLCPCRRGARSPSALLRSGCPPNRAHANTPTQEVSHRQGRARHLTPTRRRVLVLAEVVRLGHRNDAKTAARDDGPGRCSSAGYRRALWGSDAFERPGIRTAVAFTRKRKLACFASRHHVRSPADGTGRPQRAMGLVTEFVPHACRPARQA